MRAVVALAHIPRRLPVAGLDWPTLQSLPTIAPREVRESTIRLLMSMSLTISPSFVRIRMILS